MVVSIQAHSCRRASSVAGLGRFVTMSYSLGGCLDAQAHRPRTSTATIAFMSPPLAGTSNGGPRDAGAFDGVVGQLAGRGMRLDVLHVVERHEQQDAVHLDQELARLEDL